MNIKELRQAALDATKRLMDIEKAREKFMRDRECEAEIAANVLFAADTAEARRLKDIAVRACQDAEIAEAKSDSRVGQRVHSDWYDLNGVIEVRTHESVFPDNTSRYSLPQFGDLFVRVLNKDGAPSKRFDTRLHHWKPVL